MLSTLLQWGQTHYNVAFSSTSDVTSGISYDYTFGVLFSNVWQLSRDLSDYCGKYECNFKQHVTPNVIKGKKEENVRNHFWNSNRKTRICLTQLALLLPPSWSSFQLSFKQSFENIKGVTSKNTVAPLWLKERRKEMDESFLKFKP